MAIPGVVAVAGVVAAGSVLRWSPMRVAVGVALAAYLALLVALTFFPLPPSGCGARVVLQPWPLVTIVLSLRAGLLSHVGLIALGNVAAFVPMGIFVALLAPGQPAVRTALGVALVASVAVEAGQLAASAALDCGYRATDVDDVLLNGLGGLLGGAVAVALGRLGPARGRAASGQGAAVPTESGIRDGSRHRQAGR